MITEKTVKTTRNNKMMAFLTVEDLAGSVEVLVFPKDYEKRRDMLIKDEKVFTFFMYRVFFKIESGLITKTAIYIKLTSIDAEIGTSKKKSHN